MESGQIKVSKTPLDKVLLIERYAFRDFRGMYGEIYCPELYRQHGIDVNLTAEVNFSVSSKNVLRGIHGDDRTWKLISCIQGAFILVVLNFDRDSEQFGQWTSFELSRENMKQVLVPPRFGNAHLVTSDEAMFHYNQSERYRGASNQFTIRWDDPKFGIEWPIKEPLLSKRDAEVPYLKD